MGKLDKVLMAGVIAVGLTGSAAAFAATDHARATGGVAMMGSGSMMNGSMMNGRSMMNGSMMNGSMMNGSMMNGSAVPATIEGGRAVTVTADDLRFSPATITATAGEALNVTVRNTDTVTHDFMAPMLVHVVVPAGQSVTFGLRAPAAGTYPFWCTVAGHAQAGMTGTLVVTG